MFSEGLKGIVAAQTSISHIDGSEGILIYRGYEIGELSHLSFEEASFLLWYGYLPTEEDAVEIKKKLSTYRDLTPAMKDILHSLPEEMDIMSVLRTVISSLGGSEYKWKPTIEQSLRLTAVTPTIIADRFNMLMGRPLLEADTELSHVENYLFMLTGKSPSKAVADALETYMVLTMEHGMNASAFSARVTASTESDLVSAITSAIGTMKGPLHGGAPSGVIDLMNEIGVAERAETIIREKLVKGEKLMGFGHRVYKTHDPRALALRKKLLENKGGDSSLDLALFVEKKAIELLDELKPGRSLYTNVEFYAAAIMKSINLPTDLFTPTFTAARIVGWSAHVLEQAENNTIFRPQSEYIGKRNLSV
ncbi:citrate synthase/methylcitrate synthase [Rossellomorea vietnamensis]|uniref:Citrate synthase/methylcitrate synthase n=1 Tax=Rossellomorea vietnamensis TaxID=218284 RepID=A0ACD4C923_9BACI|nr:citrate synthase/methylcitrate synthase [Rossellomorea vietnamensis]UXH45126.1 citrate synthase/methylcitrate synthase [Rossellomorea vietnamensis]